MPIPGFPNYEISSYGQVFNIELNRLMRLFSDRGYLRVGLSNKGVVKKVMVHRLVAEAFLGDYHDDVNMEFIDRNPYNCHVSNLRMLGGNTVRSYIPKPTRGVPVRVIETEQIFMNAYSAASYFKTDPSTIYKVLRGERARHLGMRFEYYGGEYAQGDFS